MAARILKDGTSMKVSMIKGDEVLPFPTEYRLLISPAHRVAFQTSNDVWYFDLEESTEFQLVWQNAGGDRGAWISSVRFKNMEQIKNV